MENREGYLEPEEEEEYGKEVEEAKVAPPPAEQRKMRYSPMPVMRRTRGDSSSTSNITDASPAFIPAKMPAQLQEIFSSPQPRLECDEYIRYQSIIADTDFTTAKGVIHIRIHKPQLQGAVEVSQQSNLSDEDIKDLYANIASPDNIEHEASVSIVFCPRSFSRRQIKNVPISMQTYLAIEEIFGLPPIALQVVSSSFPMFFNFTPRLDSQNAGHRGLIMNNHIAAFCDFTLISVYDATRRTTKAICFGLSEPEISIMAKRITACLYTAHHFLTTPLLLVDYGVEELKYFTEARRAEIRQIRKYLQMETYLEGNERKALVDPTKINLAHTTAQVTSLSQSVLGLLSRGRALMKFVDGLYKELNSLGKESLPGLHINDKICQSYRLRLEYLKEAVVSAQDQLKASYEMLQVQAEAVCTQYSS